ncbi:hypothetical protein GOODEAATRI_003651 [Goodea atripinnis]|uniref:Duffy antigen/chemokine receptor n=1 Tax=Goodea atripinnis TaxID=208336 RepID=A0ABV0MZ78_9TELE
MFLDLDAVGVLFTGVHFSREPCLWRASGGAFARLLLWVLIAAFCPPLYGVLWCWGSDPVYCLSAGWFLVGGVCLGLVVFTVPLPMYGRMCGAAVALALLAAVCLPGMDVGGSASQEGVQPLCCAFCGLSVAPFSFLGWCLSLGHGGGGAGRPAWCGGVYCAGGWVAGILGHLQDGCGVGRVPGPWHAVVAFLQCLLWWLWPLGHRHLDRLRGGGGAELDNVSPCYRCSGSDVVCLCGCGGMVGDTGPECLSLARDLLPILLWGRGFLCGRGDRWCLPCCACGLELG